VLGQIKTQLEVAFAHRRIEGWHLPIDSQHQRDGMLGHRLDVGVRSENDRQADLVGVLHVNGIHPDAMVAENQQVLGRLHRFATEPCVTANAGYGTPDLPGYRIHVRSRRHAWLDPEFLELPEANLMDRLDYQAVVHPLPPSTVPT
jgi:hypothetical protein